jgi:hypothetical protein
MKHSGIDTGHRKHEDELDWDFDLGYFLTYERLLLTARSARRY